MRERHPDDMANLIGHAIPAAFLLMTSLWMAWNNLVRWHRSRLDPAAPPFRAGLRFPARGRQGVDAGFMGVCCLVGIAADAVVRYFHTARTEWTIKFSDTSAVECGNALDENWNWIYPENYQHITVFFAFFLFYLIGMLADRGYPVLPSADAVFGLFAFLVEWVLFSYHTVFYKHPLEFQIHALLLDVVKGGVVMAFLMIWEKRHILPVLGFAYTLLFQGTWFLQIGVFIHWNHAWGWSFESDLNMTIASVVFIAHLFFDAVVVLVLNGFVETSLRRGEYRAKGSEERKILISHEEEKEERGIFKNPLKREK
ncbi:unnamed protein product [Darwinula stevensoni]|uniref:Uncharacterized protein n=1 Tax=Darwinula stevensoni TaxID=69355 RepID=A0A7R9AG95_9CRUS|nr:unnamed protein product [Darwinula stevensoni]CAG0903204.1 unnamed protein product [Darwinula stevensoni]